MGDQADKIDQLRRDLELSLQAADDLGARMTAIRIMEALEALDPGTVAKDNLEAIQS